MIFFDMKCPSTKAIKPQNAGSCNVTLYVKKDFCLREMFHMQGITKMCNPSFTFALEDEMQFKQNRRKKLYWCNKSVPQSQYFFDNAIEALNRQLSAEYVMVVVVRHHRIPTLVYNVLIHPSTMSKLTGLSLFNQLK